MYRTVSFYDFSRAFEEANRGNQFTWKGMQALFEYLEQYEEDTGEEVELDVIALCCEYVEYENVAEYLDDYETDLNGEDFDREIDFNDAVKEEISEKTTLIEINVFSFIIAQY